MELFDKTSGWLERAMDLYQLRHAVIVDNIANAETPGFKSRNVSFEGELERVFKEEQSGHIRTAKALENRLDEINIRIFEDPKAEVGQDRNSVDMDREMSNLSKNDIKYSAATKMISKRFALMKYAIMEGNN